MLGSKPIAVFSIVALAIIVPATPSHPQSNADHLTCYKVKDPLKLKGTLDLDTFRVGLSQGCTFSKAAFFCAPSDARNVTDTSGVGVSSAGPRSSTDRVCYKVKCPQPAPSTQDVTDAFGTRTLEKLKTSLVCAPASRTAPIQQNGFEHRARGLAQLSEGGTALSPSVHVLSTDGQASGELPRASSDPGGGGAVVVLQPASRYSVRVRDEEDSTASLGATTMRAGAVLNVHGASLDASESMADLRSVNTGASGVSTTAYFPRLQRTQPSPPRTGTVTCKGAVVGSNTETTPGDPDWNWFSSIWPDRYETSSNATTDDAAFEWETGCVPIGSPEGGGVVLNGDRLVISIDNGSNPRLLKRAEITGGQGLSAFTLKDESSN